MWMDGFTEMDEIPAQKVSRRIRMYRRMTLEEFESFNEITPEMTRHFEDHKAAVADGAIFLITIFSFPLSAPALFYLIPGNAVIA